MIRLLLFNLTTDMDDPLLGFTTGWIQALAQRVECIHVITMRAGRVEVPGNVRVHSVGKERGYSEPHRAAVFYRHLFRLLREERINVCFSHMMPIFSILAAPVLKCKGIPTVSWYAHPSLTWRLKLAHRLSDYMVTSIATAYPYKHDKLVVVGQGIDTHLFSPDAQLTPDNPPLILCVGRLSPVKDHPTLLRAAALLREQLQKPFRVVIVGDPTGPQDEPYVRSLHQQVKKLALEGAVFFEPAVPMENLPCWYRRCTVYVNLTPTGSGDKVAWEAMACGRPCLVANQGFRETLGKYSDDLLFCFGESGDMANKLAQLLTQDQIKHDEIGSYLRQQVIRMHSLAGLASNLTALFQALRHKSKHV